jgi:nitrile hydratase
MSFHEGDRVRTSGADPDHHHRVPRYARAKVGVVLEQIGEHPLPEDSVRGLSTVEPVYTVRFDSRDLFGEGEHAVTLDIWQSHLDPA